MDLNMGSTVFQVQMPGSSREAIALFSQATEDPNPIHVDPKFAKRCGFNEVIQQGPMTTAYIAQLLTNHFGQDHLLSLDLTFTAPVFPEEPLTLTSTVVGLGEVIELEINAQKKDGSVTAKGNAQVRYRA